MSSPPRYQRTPGRAGEGDEESLPLKQYMADNDADLDLDQHEGATTYPPTRQAGPSRQQATSAVKYTFNPRWPIEGKPENALGVFGGSREVSRIVLSMEGAKFLELSRRKIEHWTGYHAPQACI